MKLNEFPIVFGHIKIAETITSTEVFRAIFDTISGTLIEVNEEVLRLLRLCDGSHTVLEIIEYFSGEYSEEPISSISEKVMEALSQLKAANIIDFLDAKQKPRKTVSSVSLSHNLRKVMLEVTSNCNLRCLHCYGNFGYKNDELMTDEWKAIIDELDSLNVLEVHLTGGEPLLRKDIFELIEYIRKKPMAVTISTNGTLIDEHIADRISKLKVRTVRVSLDGAHPETHDSFRGVKGTFEKTVNSIKLLHERKVPLRINCCVTKHNFKEIPQMIQLLKKLEVDEYVFSVVYFSGRDSCPPDLCFSPTDYKEFEFVVEAIGHQPLMEDIAEYEFNEEIVNCGLGMGSLVIQSDGKVIPCAVFDREEFVVGDVKSSSIREIWENSEFLNKLRAINARQIPKCSACKHLTICRGGCRARAHRILGDVCQPDPFACLSMSFSERLQTKAKFKD